MRTHAPACAPGFAATRRFHRNNPFQQEES
jgi:hypothetical protein